MLCVCDPGFDRVNGAQIELCSISMFPHLLSSCRCSGIGFYWMLAFFTLVYIVIEHS